MIRVTFHYCMDCKVRFNVYKNRGGRKFCPLCGDCISVERYVSAKHNPRKNPSFKQNFWTVVEEDELRDWLKTDLYYKEISEKMGRTCRSVQRKIQKLGIQRKDIVQ